ncbi:MAG: hydrogenase maturation protease [Planctomycetota bacterium]
MPPLPAQDGAHGVIASRPGETAASPCGMTSDDLRRWLTESGGANPLILGVGNRLRGDDGAGCHLIDRISDTGRVRCIDGGCAPENHIERVATMRPGVVWLVDAVDFGGRPGELRVFPPERMGGDALSTHAGSLRLCCEYLRSRAEIPVVLIGIQPESVVLGRALSAPVSRAVERLAGILREAGR